MLDKLTEMFKALGEPTRLRLAMMLAVRGEQCVCHLASALDEPDYKASRHLGVLKNAGLVNARREGTWMHYSLDDGSTVEALADILRKCARRDPQAQEDLRRFKLSACGSEVSK